MSLNHQVVIQTPTEGTPDAMGATAQTWATYATLWAEVLPQSGREFLAAKQVYADLTHLLRIRYKSGVTNAMRVYWLTRYLNIVSVVNVEARNRYMMLYCVEQL